MCGGFGIFSMMPMTWVQSCYTVTIDAMKSVGFIVFCIITNPTNYTKYCRNPRIIRMWCIQK
jgi:hypothetical protein